MEKQANKNNTTAKATETKRQTKTTKRNTSRLSFHLLQNSPLLSLHLQQQVANDTLYANKHHLGRGEDNFSCLKHTFDP